MKKLIYLLSILTITSCNSQEKESQQAKENYEKEKDKTIVKPQEKWDVRKKYDDYGNLIEYDSIYSWSYSNVKGDSLRVNLDSLMDSFKGYFGENAPFKWNDDFFYFPKNDSLFMKDFFKEDYFFSSWQNQHHELDEMIKRMDSTRNSVMK